MHKLLEKVRPNVVLLTSALLGTVIWLFHAGFTEPAIFVASITGVVGVIGMVAQDPPPPTVPASTVDKILDKLG